MFRKKKECEHHVSHCDLLMALGAAVFGLIKAYTTYRTYNHDRLDKIADGEAAKNELRIIIQEGNK